MLRALIHVGIDQPPLIPFTHHLGEYSRPATPVVVDDEEFDLSVRALSTMPLNAAASTRDGGEMRKM